jgi:CRP/FNR family transcriptional regulator, anaerobic regulatory protein
MQQHRHRVFSHETVREQRVTLLPDSMRDEERVAAFLLNLSERLTALGHSPSDLVLQMTREEMSSLVEINLETVTRILSKFQEHALIDIDGEHVRIVSIEGLRAVVSR